jgi:hypothetical protein
MVGLKRANQMIEFTQDSEHPTFSVIYQMVFLYPERGECKWHVVLLGVIMVFEKMLITFIK